MCLYLLLSMPISGSSTASTPAILKASAEMLRPFLHLCLLVVVDSVNTKLARVSSSNLSTLAILEVSEKILRTFYICRFLQAVCSTNTQILIVIN